MFPLQRYSEIYFSAQASLLSYFPNKMSSHLHGKAIMRLKWVENWVKDIDYILYMFNFFLIDGKKGFIG